MSDTFESIGKVAERVVRKADDSDPRFDPYALWNKAVEINKGRRKLTRDEMKSLGLTTEPQSGFWRKRNKTGTDISVAIWPQDGALVASANGKWTAPDEIWTWCCSWPITWEIYTVVEKGAAWPDEEPMVAAQVAAAHTSDGEARPNEIPESQQIADNVAEAVTQAKQYETIADDDHAGKAQSLRSLLLKLSGEADKTREKLKKPHLDAGRAIDAEYQPIVKSGKEGADKIRRALEAFETKKLQERRRQEDAARKAAEEAERKRDEKEASFVSQEPSPQPEAAPVPAADVQTKIAGSYGRAASIGTEFAVKSIEDYDALYGYMKVHPDLKACLLDLASRAVKAGRRDIPGITLEEVARVR